MVSGPPGAGKSTVARRLAERSEPSALVAGDAFFAFLARGAIPPWLPAADEQNAVVVEAAAAAAGRLAAGGLATVYDGVLGPWFLGAFATATGLGTLDYVVLLPSAERCVRQVRHRRDHDFRDEPATRSMHEQFVAAGLDERFVVHEPPDDPDAVAGLVQRRVEEGLLRYEVAGD